MEAKVQVSGNRPIGGGFKDLTSLRVFASIVELQSFSEVARRSGVGPATVSRR
jgi:hypothetical protein